MSSGFTVDPAVLARAEALVARIASDLVAERRSLDGSVSSLLDAGWSGPASDQYRDAWVTWREGADQVLDALREIGEAMGQARIQLVTSDQGAADRAAPLSARMQERLS